MEERVLNTGKEPSSGIVAPLFLQFIQGKNSISWALSSGDYPFFIGSWSSILLNSSAASTSELVFRSGSIQAHYDKLGFRVQLLSCNGLLLLVGISSRVIFFFSYVYDIAEVSCNLRINVSYFLLYFNAFYYHVNEKGPPSFVKL